MLQLFIFQCLLYKGNFQEQRRHRYITAFKVKVAVYANEEGKSATATGKKIHTNVLKIYPIIIFFLVNIYVLK